jgi:predicted RNA-binding Zn-ribbon protein involved in translation (DUF1610 family)
MAADEEFLFYPLDTGEDPACLTCGDIMVVSTQELRDARPHFLTFRCPKCGRSEKYVTE